MPKEINPQDLQQELLRMQNQPVLLAMNAWQGFVLLNGLFGIEAQAIQHSDPEMVEHVRFMQQTVFNCVLPEEATTQLLANNREILGLPRHVYTRPKPKPEPSRIITPP